MGLSCSRKKKHRSHSPEFVTVQDASYIKVKVKPDKRTQPTEHIVELLYELPENRREYFKKCVIEDTHKISDKAFQEQEELDTTQAPLLEKTSRQSESDYLGKLPDNLKSYSYRLSEISSPSEDFHVLEPEKNIFSLKVSQIQSSELSQKYLKEESPEQSKMSFKSSKKLLEERKSTLPNKIDEENEECCKQEASSCEVVTALNDTTSRCEQTSEKESLPKVDTLSLDISQLEELPKNCKISAERQAYTSKYVDEDGKSVYISATLYQEVAQSPMNKFWNKLTPKMSSLKKIIPHDHKPHKHVHKEESYRRKKAHSAKMQSKCMERTLEVQTIENSETVLNLPYHSSSLIIIPSRSFSNQQLQSEEELPKKRSTNERTHSQQLQSVQTNKNIQTSRKNSFQEQPDLKIMQTQTEHNHYRECRHKSSSDPSAKMIRLLQKKYDKKFKTLDELVRMPPKNLILFITSGELKEPCVSIKPTITLVKYKQVLKSIKSGI